MVSIGMLIYKVRSEVGNTVKQFKGCVRRCLKGNRVLIYKDKIITDHKALEQIMDDLGFESRHSVMGTVYRQFHHRGFPRGSFIVSFPSEQLIDRPLLEYLVFTEPVNNFVGQEVFSVVHSRKTKIPKLARRTSAKDPLLGTAMPGALNSR